MKESSGQIIRNGAIATILGGIVLLFISKEMFYSIWSVLSSLPRWIWEKLIDSYALAGWLWIPVIILSLIGITTIIMEIKINRVNNEPEHYSYKEDVIHAAKWRWNWHNGNVSNLCCFCPSCDANLVYNDSTVRHYLSDEAGTKFICENCNYRIVTKIEHGDREYALNLVTREIDRRVRTGQYSRPNS